MVYKGALMAIDDLQREALRLGYDCVSTGQEIRLRDVAPDGRSFRRAMIFPTERAAVAYVRALAASERFARECR